ncbi:MAG: aminoglycoside phosphotransferase family protein [Acidobacteriota bacterium]
MTSTYAHQFPKELVKNVTAMCGQTGKAWLNDLPGLIDEIQREWSIRVGEPFQAGEFNFVAPAIRFDSDPTVLKISPPFPTIEISGEAEYLRSRDGNGAVKLLVEDAARRAILLERAIPGKNLAEDFADNKPAAIEPAIGVLRSILLPAPSRAADIVTLDHWFSGLRKYATTDFPAKYASKALRIYDELSRQPNRTFYLHGDFHPGNVVTAMRTPFLAIDPKGIIGHLGYEIAVFLNNFHWWQETEPDIGAIVAHAVDQFSDAFEIDPNELRRWAFAQMVLGAWWSFDETPAFYNNEVAKADIWDV